MIERGVTVEDVRAVLMGHSSCRAAGDRWCLTGLDIVGEPLGLIVELAPDVIVVTLFRGDE